MVAKKFKKKVVKVDINDVIEDRDIFLDFFETMGIDVGDVFKLHSVLAGKYSSLGYSNDEIYDNLKQDYYMKQWVKIMQVATKKAIHRMSQIELDFKKELVP